MTSETWRVVLASGEVREVVARWPVARYGIPRWGAEHREDEHTGFGASARAAVLDCVTTYRWEVAEILAPGEPTRAELRAQAWREGAEAMRAEAAEVAEWSWATQPDHRGMCAASHAVADEIRNLPVPPCPEALR